MADCTELTVGHSIQRTTISSTKWHCHQFLSKINQNLWTNHGKFRTKQGGLRLVSFSLLMLWTVCWNVVSERLSSIKQTSTVDSNSKQLSSFLTRCMPQRLSPIRKSLHNGNTWNARHHENPLQLIVWAALVHSLTHTNLQKLTGANAVQFNTFHFHWKLPRCKMRATSSLSIFQMLYTSQITTYYHWQLWGSSPHEFTSELSPAEIIACKNIQSKYTHHHQCLHHCYLMLNQ